MHAPSLLSTLFELLCDASVLLRSRKPGDLPRARLLLVLTHHFQGERGRGKGCFVRILLKAVVEGLGLFRRRKSRKRPAYLAKLQYSGSTRWLMYSTKKIE